MVLVEAFEAIVEIDGCFEGLCQRECPSAGGSNGTRSIVDVYFLVVGSREDESEAQTDADGTFMNDRVLKMM